jgi:hypothetical protein
MFGLLFKNLFLDHNMVGTRTSIFPIRILCDTTFSSAPFFLPCGLAFFITYWFQLFMIRIYIGFGMLHECIPCDMTISNEYKICYQVILLLWYNIILGYQCFFTNTSCYALLQQSYLHECTTVDWSFTVLRPVDNLQSYWGITIAGEGWPLLGIITCEDILLCHTCCDTEPRFLWSHSKDCPMLLSLKTNKEYWGPILTQIPTGHWSWTLCVESTDTFKRSLSRIIVPILIYTSVNVSKLANLLHV